MRKEVKRQVYAWLLLSVFVPMIALSALHVHEVGCDDTTVCSACINHQAHAGHLTAGIDNIHDCVLCQFLSLSFVAATTVLTVMLSINRRSLVTERESLFASASNTLHGTRAPPYDE